MIVDNADSAAGPTIHPGRRQRCPNLRDRQAWYVLAGIRGALLIASYPICNISHAFNIVSNAFVAIANIPPILGRKLVIGLKSTSTTSSFLFALQPLPRSLPSSRAELPAPPPVEMSRRLAES